MAEVHVPQVKMASVAIRPPQHLEVTQHENTYRRDDEKKAHHTVPPQTHPHLTAPRRHRALRNDAAVRIGADDGGAVTASAGVDGAGDSTGLLDIK